MDMKVFFETETNTLSYLVWSEKSREAVIIDPVLDYDQKISKFWGAQFDLYVKEIEQRGLSLKWILETHPHADHLSCAQKLKEKFGARLAIGAGVTLVQKTFRTIFNFGQDHSTEGGEFDYLLKDHEVLELEGLKIEVRPTPGHTPACVSYLINDQALFVGDVIFMPDYGTGRCDFPNGSAEILYNSIIQKIYTLPDEVKIYPGHDYLPGGRPLKYQTTVGEQKRSNIHLTLDRSKQQFVEMREARDKTLSAPKLLLPSIQFNIWGGKIPHAESNGKLYLKIPFSEK